MRTNDEVEQQHGPPVDIWVSLVILIRVAVILIFFLTLFLAIFMGYFTLPLVLIAAVTVVYMLFDVGINISNRRRKQPPRSDRDVLLHTYQDQQEHKD